MLQSNSLFEKVVELVQTEQDLRIVFNTLEGSYALCLLANLVHLAYEECSTSLPMLAFPKFNVSFFTSSQCNNKTFTCFCCCRDTVLILDYSASPTHS